MMYIHILYICRGGFMYMYIYLCICHIGIRRKFFPCNTCTTTEPSIDQTEDDARVKT